MHINDDLDPIELAIEAWNIIIDADLNVIRDALETVVDIDKENGVDETEAHKARHALVLVNRLLARIA